MTKREMINRVAAGIRSCNEPPDYFIFVDNEAVEWNDECICNIPVLYSSYKIRHMDNHNVTHESLFIPVWKDIMNVEEDVNYFEGYDNYCE